MGLTYSHDLWFVIASLAVALIAGFTGLSITSGLSRRSIQQQKVAISLAAIALGGGIWSMHFVAMLGLQLPVMFYYDAATTLASALVAILVVGLALLLLHFWQRSWQTIAAAGCIVGFGIIAMHYIGMAALEMCQALYTPQGIAVAALASCLLNMLAFGIAYGRRTQKNILLGTVCFGLAVFAVHFIAVTGTSFVATEQTSVIGPLLSKQTLALGVVLTVFVLCGAFLLTGVTVLAPGGSGKAPAVSRHGEAELPTPQGPVPTGIAVEPETSAPPAVLKVPYERNGQTMFVSFEDVAAVRAEGHYTHIYTSEGQHFCAWSISEAERRLTAAHFIKTHRSYLVNPSQVVSLERRKDGGSCLFGISDMPPVPVSRSRLKQVCAALGI